MTAAPAADLLATIVAATRRRVSDREQRVTLAEVRRRAEAAGPSRRGFAASLAAPGVRIIAECKRRSPSRGVLRRDYDPAGIARGYARAGAAAISVLTEPGFFDGALSHLADVVRAVDVPVLRKDFIVSEYQIWEARAAGADAVLLIVAALEAAVLRALQGATAAAGLEALVEVHDERELEAAVAAGAAIVGVNNRNLKTLAVDTEASRRLAPLIPASVIAVAESGLRTGEELHALQAAGYTGFLIGERLMAAPDPGAALRELLYAAETVQPATRQQA